MKLKSMELLDKGRNICVGDQINIPAEVIALVNDGFDALFGNLTLYSRKILVIPRLLCEPSGRLKEAPTPL